MKQINFESVVAGYLSTEAAHAPDVPIGLRAIGFSAGALIFRGRHTEMQVPRNQPRTAVEVALFELHDDAGAQEYHCLTQSDRRFAIMCASEAEVTRTDSGLFIPSMGLRVAATPDGLSRLGLVHLMPLPLVPDHLPAQLVSAGNTNR